MLSFKFMHAYSEKIAEMVAFIFCASLCESLMLMFAFSY